MQPTEEEITGGAETLPEEPERKEEVPPDTDQGGTPEEQDEFLISGPGHRRRTLSATMKQAYRIVDPIPKDRRCGSAQWRKHCKIYGICGAPMVALALIAIVFMSLYLRREQECECPSCPNKWTRYNHTCYFVSKKSAVWKESREYCEKHGGSLLILNQTVGQQIEELFSLQQDHWIGLEKDLGIKEWRWVNGSVHRDLVRYGDNLQLNCAYINGDIGALDCSSPRRWICMKSLWSGHVPEDLQETESV